MQVILNNQVIPVEINYKKIKNIYFRFSDDLKLIVNANIKTKEKEIISLIEKNKKSLERLLKKVENKQNKEQEFWFLGTSYSIIFSEDYEQVDFQGKSIYCKNEEMLQKFLKVKTKEIFTAEVLAFKNIITTPTFTLKIRKMKTRWGVCNYKDCIITLNSELIKYKIEDLRYVIVHEMCHFKHHNHSQDFWHMVASFYPNYKEARKDLRE